MTSKIASFLQIRPGEGRLVGWLAALFLLPNLGGAAGSPAVEALFYARFGVEFLPVMYLALGGVTFSASMLLAGLQGRVSRRALYSTLPLLLAGMLVAARLLVGMDLNWFYPVLWLGAYLLWALQALFTWGLAGWVCDTRQAKRLFPLFGAGGILGIALGGLAARLLANLIGAENLLLIWALALIASFGLVLSLTAALDEPRRASRRSAPGFLREIQKGFDYVRRTPLMRWIALGSVLFSVLYFSLAFPFSKAVAAQFPDEDALAGFLGIFQGLKAAVEFAVALLLANRLYARFGFMGALLAFPGIYFAGFGLMLLGGTFAALAAFRFAQMVWLSGVADTAYQSIFNIVPAASREQTRAFLRGVPEQLGVILAGLLLSLGLADRQTFVMGMGMAALAGAALWRGSKAYRAALVSALRAGQPQIFASEEQPFAGLHRDAQAVEIVIAGASDPNPATRQISVEILGSVAAPAAVPALIRALEDFDPHVRQAALHALARADAPAALLEVAASLNDISPDVRLAAIRALEKLTRHARGLRIHLAPLLGDPEPDVRAAAAAALLRAGRYLPAETVLFQMGQSDDVHERIAALYAFADLGSPAADWQNGATYQIALRALADPQPGVRQAAAAALPRIDPARGQPALIVALADPDASVRAEVARALGELGEGVLPALLRALDDPAREDGALLALRQLPAWRVASGLQTYARRKAAQALRLGGLCVGVLRAPPGWDRPALALLAAALRHRALQHAQNALRALGLLDDPDGMAVALANLNSGNAALQANALEMIDSLPDRELLRPLLALWEADRPAGEAFPEVEQPLTEILLSLLAEEDEWLVACAVRACAGRDDSPLTAALARLRQSASHLVAETAAYVLSGANMDTLPTIPIMERILYLQRVPLFESLSPAELKQIAAITGEHLFLDGETIARQGEPGEELYIIVSGEVEVILRQPDGAERTLARRKPGEHVGEMSVISRQPRMASLVARGVVRALCLEQQHFEAMLRERPEISLTVMRQLIARVREQNTAAV